MNFSLKTLIRGSINKGMFAAFTVRTTRAENTIYSRLNYIDGLKGIAALVVFTGHFLISFYPGFSGFGENCHQQGWAKYVALSPFSAFYNGHFAVMIFFILSGYGLSYKYFIRGQHSPNFIAFIKRYFRLTIPVFFSCLLAYVCLEVGLFFNHETAVLTHSSWLEKFYLFEPDFFKMVKFALYDVYVNYKEVPSYNPPLWVFKYFLWGSFLVFIIIELFSYIKNNFFRFIIYFILIILLLNTYYVNFIIGMILCDNEIKKPGNIKILKNRYFLIFLLLMGTYLGAARRPDLWMGPPLNFIFNQFGFITEILLQSIGAFFIIYVLINSKSMQKLLSFRYLVFFGKISFYFYLIHFIFLCSASCFIFNYLSTLNLNKFLIFIVDYSFTILLVFFLSYLFSIFLDKTNRLLDRL